jgi:hypothetical protein
MAKKHDRKLREKETQQASTLIALCSIAGLTAIVIYAPTKDAPTTLLLYGIFGGGILGTDNVLKFIKAIFRLK